MKILKKINHFLCSIKRSVPSLIIGTVLIIVVLLLLAKADNDSLSLSFVVGIIASVVATLLLRITETYSKSIEAFSAVLFRTSLLISFFEENINADNYYDQKFRERLLNHYFDICEKYESITYKKDYNKISKAIKGLIDNCNKNNEFDSVLNAKELLIETVSEI